MKKILFCCIVFSFTSLKSDNNLDNEKYLNFLAAMQNVSTFNYFTVIRVKNLNSGEIKEICTKGNFISGALHSELNADYDAKGESKVLSFVKKNKDRYFEFKSKKALNNISFFEYDSKQFAKIQKKYSLAKAIDSIKKSKKFELPLSDKEMPLFAHLLFNEGYLTGENDCFGGTIVYVDRNKIQQ
jgi:hypothetical protein